MSLFFSNSRILSSLHLILALIVFGSSFTNSISLGYLYGAVVCLTCCWISLTSFSDGSYPSFNTAKTLTTSPLIGCGLGIIADSSTDSCELTALSTSKGPILYPELIQTSSALESNQMYPASSKNPGRSFMPEHFPGHDFVAGGNHHYPIELMGLDHEFNSICNSLPAWKGISHSRVALAMPSHIPMVLNSKGTLQPYARLP